MGMTIDDARRELISGKPYTDKFAMALVVAIDTMRKYQELEQEPTTKNDLGVDCVSREQALAAIRSLYPCMPRVDFNGSLRKWVDKYKPYIECDDAIKQLPSVTPQEPIHGEWLGTEYDGYSDGFPVYTTWKCSNCRAEFECEDIMDLYYCPNCGAYMDEGVEQ